MIGNEYPTEKQLQIIVDWDIMTQGVMELVDYIENHWWTPEWGFKLKGKKNVFWLELHTGGWSGNEDVIRALWKNPLFVALFWRKTYVGGHYYFKMNVKNFKIEGGTDETKKGRGVENKR